MRKTPVATLFLFAAFSSVCGGVVQSDVEVYLDTALIQTSGEPVVGAGTFYGYRNINEGPGEEAFAKCTNVAATAHVPLAMLWSNVGCHYCSGVAKSFNEDAGLSQWMSSQGAVFAYFKDSCTSYNNMHEPQQSVYWFIRGFGATDNWPLYVFCWWKPDGTFVREAGTWRNSSEEFRSAFEEFVAANAGEDVVSGDVVFACGSSQGARLEATPSTSGVWVPLSRTNNCAVAATGTITAVYPDGGRATSNIVWAAESGVPNQLQEVFFPVAGNWEDGGIVALQLRDASGALNATNAITCVSEEVSHHVPLWIGERTEADLGWGEWTFDYDVATNKVRIAAEAGTAAYTLVIAGGGLWCPDCMSCETYLTGDDRFPQWAASRKIALVVSDQPQNGTTKSSMMTHDVGSRGNSGSYYLSRKGLTIAEGMAQFTAMTNRSYRLWKVEPTAVRVSNPTFILFRPDGTIAGRMNESRVKEPGVRQNSEKYDFAENMARLDELLALVGDDEEERNNKPGTTGMPEYAFGTTNSCCLQVSDTADVFPFLGVPAGEKFRVVATGSAGAKAVPSVRILAVTNVANGAFLNISPLQSGGDVWRLTQAQVDAGVFLEVSAYASEADGRYAVYGGDTAFTATFHSKTVPLAFGSIGFTTSAISVAEGRDSGFFLTVERVDGVDGAVSAVVSLDLGSTTPDNLSRIGWDVAVEHRLEWGDADGGARDIFVPVYNDAVWDGDAEFKFSLVVEGAAAAGEFTVCTVTLREDDAKSAGTLRISGCNPPADAMKNVYVREGEPLVVDVERVGGSWGEAVGRLVLGDFTTNIVWANKDRQALRRVPIDISGMSAGEVVALSLVGAYGAALDAASRRLTVHVLAHDAPKFNSEPLPFEIVSATGCDAVLAQVEGGVRGARLVRTGGRDADGVDIEFDEETGELKMTGAAKTSGEFSSTWRLVRATDDGRLEYGVPVTIAYAVRSVADIVPALATSRSWTGLPAMGVSDVAEHVAGLLDLSVPANGRTSAKFRTVDGVTVSFSSSFWQEVGNGYLRSSMDGTRSGWRLSAMACADGTVFCEVAGPNGDSCTAAAPAVSWMHDNGGTVLSDWKGVYTVEMPQATNDANSADALCAGPATFSLRFTAGSAVSRGVVTCAGVLPNGKTASGSFVLQPSGDAGMLLLPVFMSTASDTIGALLRVAGGGAALADETRQVIRSAEGVLPRWRHREGAVSSAGYEVSLDAFGSYYVPENWAVRIYSDYFGAESLTMWLNGMEGVLSGLSLRGDGTGICVEGGHGSNFTLAFSPATGVARGTFTAEVGGISRTVSWCGVVLPGWAEGCGCGFVDEDEVVRPFLSAAAWWTEKRTFIDDFGRSRSTSIRAGAELRTR